MQKPKKQQLAHALISDTSHVLVRSKNNGTSCLMLDQQHLYKQATIANQLISFDSRPKQHKGTDFAMPALVGYASKTATQAQLQDTVQRSTRQAMEPIAYHMSRPYAESVSVVDTHWVELDEFGNLGHAHHGDGLVHAP